MRNQGQLVFGLLLIAFGLMLLFSNLTGIDIWALCWPTALILVGVWLLFRPRLTLPGAHVNLRPFGDVRRYGVWQPQDEEIWMFVGDINLDYSRAEFPPGETVLRLTGFISDVDLLVPPELGLLVTSTAFLSSTKVLGRNQDTFLVPYQYTSPNYLEAEHRLRVELTAFVTDLAVDQV